MDLSFKDFLKHLKESGRSKELSGGDFMRKASALWRGVEYRKAKSCTENSDCGINQRCGARGGCLDVRRRVVSRSSPKRSSPNRSSPKRSSPKRSSPKRSSPKRSSPKRSSPKRSSPNRSSYKKQYQNFRLLQDRILERLQKDERLFPFMDANGFVEISKIPTHGLTALQLGDRIEVQVRDNGTYVRAMYGWKGPIAFRVLGSQYQPYCGNNRVFCITHKSMFGLGELNFGRRVNVLDTPDRCINKGVKACLNIADAGKKGLTFFSKLGDRYGNRIFCFDANLNEHFTSFEYTDQYIEKLDEVNEKALASYMRLMSEAKAHKMLRGLFISSP
jgi:hypothetical protein